MPRLLDHFVVVQRVEAVNAIPLGALVTVVYPEILSAKKAHAIQAAASKRGFAFAPAPEWFFGPRAAGKRRTWPFHRTTRTWLALHRAARQRQLFKAIVRGRSFARVQRINALAQPHVPDQYYLAFADWMHHASRHAVLMSKVLGHVLRVFVAIYPDDLDYLPQWCAGFPTLVIPSNVHMATSICVSAAVCNFLYMKFTYDPLLFYF